MLPMNDSRHIENLIYHYAELIDAGDLKGVAELFRNAVIVSPAHNSRCTGYDEVLQMYQQSARLYAPAGTPMTKHLTTNVIIELEDGSSEANARSYYTVIQSTDSLPLQPIISGRYHDRFVNTGSSWVFSVREMHVDLIGDCSAHLLYDSSKIS
ncbi:nuclear transport factor 2 family protein [Candidatus Marimicrobium litorale]|nr:nuclear transport factor 2 family protein [Candidatus Marimicrobium litorale]